MAANDFYHSSYPSKPYHDYDNRNDAPLPPLPTTDSASSLPQYPYSHPTPSRSYSGLNGRLVVHDSDPYNDNDSIPLNGRKKHDSTTTVSPILPNEIEDPYVRDADPRKRRRKAKDGWFTGKITWVVFVLTAIQLVVFLAEIIQNGVLTKSPIMIHPAFNPMIGPSYYVLINMGARYQPCMHNMPDVQNATVPISWPCPNTTSLAAADCSLSELCGFNGVPNPVPGGSLDQKPEPNQWWRFIVPIFLHAGIIHISFNLLLQLTLGRDVEKLIGSIRFAIVYFAAGIFGFVLGGNYAASGIASCGCSGSLFGILAITLLDLLYTWNQRPGPIKDLLFIGLDVIIAFVLGLLPGLDNFSHIGGFLMGLVLGVCVLRSPSAIARRTGPTDVYGSAASITRTPSTRGGREASGLMAFVRDPLNFFQHRRGVWWAWWLLRVGALVGALVCFILLVKNFYQWGYTCGWCKYLSCLPVTVNGENWCKVGYLNFTNTTTTPSNHTRRGMELAFNLAYEQLM